MATTYLQALNRVLEIIGEDQVSEAATSITDDYHKLVGAFLNDIKEQVEDAHNWRALRQTLTASITAGNQSGTITGANERSRLVRIYQSDSYGEVPLVFDITDSSNPDRLIEIDLAELLHKDTLDPNSSQDPTFFAIDNSSGDGMDMYVYPRPSGTRTIQVTMVVPQARLDHTAPSTTISVPVRPIVLGTTWYSLEERGEELGAQSLFSEKRFQDALNDAVGRDAAEQGNNMELISV